MWFSATSREYYSIAAQNTSADTLFAPRLAERLVQMTLNPPGLPVSPNTKQTSDVLSVTNKRILHVDDEDIIRELVGNLLRKAGYYCRGAADGIEALDVLESDQDFDLILSEVMMNRLDGFGLLDRTKVLYPDIPFVFLAPVRDNAIKLAALRNGAYDYVLFPCEMDEIVFAVNRALEYGQLKLENRALRTRLESMTT